MASKQPVKKVSICFKSFDNILTRIVINYSIFQRFLDISLTLYLQGGLKHYKTRIGLKPILQHVYGMEDWSSMELEGPVFESRVLPVLVRSVEDSLEVYQDANDKNRFYARLLFSTPQMINLEDNDRHYNVKKQEGVE